jgi:hypothetical protein
MLIFFIYSFNNFQDFMVDMVVLSSEAEALWGHRGPPSKILSISKLKGGLGMLTQWQSIYLIMWETLDSSLVVAKRKQKKSNTSSLTSNHIAKLMSRTYSPRWNFVSFYQHLPIPFYFLFIWAQLFRSHM